MPDSSADTGQEGLWIPASTTRDGLEALVAAAYRRMSRRASTFREEKMSEFSLMIGENVSAKKGRVVGGLVQLG